MMGIDADYSMSRVYRSQGWPSFIVVDPDGMIRFHGFDSDRNLSGLRRCVQELVDKQPPDAARNITLERRIALLPDALAARRAPRDRSPRLAFDPSGKPRVIYYSNRDGTNAVYLRSFNQKGERVADERVSPADAECYAADCTFDPQGTLWITWCARQKKCYDIHVQSRAPGKDPVTEQLSFSADDAMSPKIAAGPDGTITVAYYKWHMLWNSSRDRDIFARTYDPAKHAWGKEFEVSPPQPEVEDHTDPDVVIDKQGNSWIVWSFDYHPQLYKQPLAADQPTIFAAKATGNTVSGPMLVGATGQFREAIDFFPSAALDEQGVLWCAWDCSEPSRGIRVAKLLSPAANAFTEVSRFGTRTQFCSTPELSPAKNNLLLLAWSQRGPAGLWQGKAGLLKEGRLVADTTLTEPVDVLFPQMQQSPDGQYWVVYEKSAPKGAEIVLRNITRELASSQAKTAGAQ